ncbi:MAG TPA: Gfo/Idh/MocA family oxidoreductase [Candidatus Latescibacteria bacterium]|nr:Gfo/Idh/MocA family oxidoreductase [Candidatus Latescibacterota bacterium]HJP31374.1 Gfo/Idh/MocA family oxidoreductase [Candidatus Latescibacterota bacterium]
MSDYRTAIIGVSGARARGHAEAYAHIDRGHLVAVSSRNSENVAAFGEHFGVPARYTDYRLMLAKERPDVVHVNTPPNVRLEVFEAAADAGVPALIVEKPLAIDGEDWTAISEWAARAPAVKIAVNHQLHFQPRRRLLQERVVDGAIGGVRFVDVSAGMNLAYQGTHALQAIGAFHPAGVPETVFAQVSGAEGLADTPRKHLAPDRCLAAIAFADGVTARLQCGPQAPRVGREGINTHKRIAIYGERGFVHWWMWGWEMAIDGVLESGTHEYPDQDILGQAAMTEAMFDWLEDDGAVHPLCLENSLRDFNVVLGIYASSLRREVVDLPFVPEPGLIPSLRAILGANNPT